MIGLNTSAAGEQICIQTDLEAQRIPLNLTPMTTLSTGHIKSYEIPSTRPQQRTLGQIKQCYASP